ncbi:MAG TPA: cytochrome P450 [Solirubrobacterales bacterium]|nr:cytochrome P450 [Solirubrobacterales bacterium]
MRRTLDMVDDPLSILMPLYEEYGPVFTVRLLHVPTVFMLGPAANRFVTVEHPECFHWREGSFGDLIPLLGDGLLTTDGAYHDQARAIMMPAFHREGIDAAVTTMVEEADRAMAGWRPGQTVDLYAWMRNLAMRIAMRALLGLDPDDAGSGARAAEYFERALAFYGIDFHKRMLRGPGSPFQKLVRSRRTLDEIVYAEITRRRRETGGADGAATRSGAAGGGAAGGGDILSLLIGARDEQGRGLEDSEIRDQVMTLMFAGHDTSTSTVTFMAYELARHPEAMVKVAAELDAQLDEAALPPAAQLDGAALPELEKALDETLRLYPPAWIGPRRSVRAFEFAGTHVPAGAFVSYCSWASHRLPEVFPDPETFDPERFTRERKAALPKGAYVPFGAGSRICIGKRFGQSEVRAVMAMLLSRYRLELAPGRTMRIRQMPTLSPRDGLLITLRDR